MGVISGSGISFGVGNDNPQKFACLENSMDTGAWRAAVHRVSKSLTQLSGHTRMHKWRHFQEESKRSHPLLFNSIIEVLANKEQSIRGIRIHGAMHGPVGLLGPGPLCPLFLWSQETAFTQPPWPSLSANGQIQGVVNYGRKELGNQRNSQEEYWGKVLLPHQRIDTISLCTCLQILKPLLVAEVND